MNLKKLRIMRGIQATELAEACGLSKQCYAQIERKGIAHTDEATARKIADYLGVNVFLLAGADVFVFKPRTTEDAKILKKTLSSIVSEQ